MIEHKWSKFEESYMSDFSLAYNEDIHRSIILKKGFRVLAEICILKPNKTVYNKSKAKYSKIPKPPKICVLCDKKAVTGKYCSKHYRLIANKPDLRYKKK